MGWSLQPPSDIVDNVRRLGVTGLVVGLAIVWLVRRVCASYNNKEVLAAGSDTPVRQQSVWETSEAEESGESRVMAAIASYCPPDLGSCRRHSLGGCRRRHICRCCYCWYPRSRSRRFRRLAPSGQAKVGVSPAVSGIATDDSSMAGSGHKPIRNRNRTAKRNAQRKRAKSARTAGRTGDRWSCRADHGTRPDRRQRRRLGACHRRA